MKIFKTLLALVIVAAALSGAAYAGGRLLHDDPRTTAASGALPGAPASSATASPTSPSTSPSTSDPSPTNDTPAVADVLKPGATGLRVRELQQRLFQLAWLPETTTGRYDAATAAAVKGFQGKRGLEPTGVVDAKTWSRLRAMTTQPTHDALFNVMKPGRPLFQSGDTGTDVRAVQARLKQIAWYFGDVTGTYDAGTVTAVKGFQEKRAIPVTGAVDQRTLDRLNAMTTAPTNAEMHNRLTTRSTLDARCLTGRVLCIDKTSRTLRWVVDGHVQQTLEARFGSTLNDTPTREGVFHVYLMDADHVSHLYGSSMPFSMFFSGGQAVHYSSDFAAVGYNGASHGCVNIRDYDGIKWLFSQVHVGDKVVVYWS